MGLARCAVTLLLGLAAACRSQPHWPDPTPTTCDPSAWPEGEIVVQVSSGRQARHALAWIPPTEGPWDVAVVFHEFRADPRRQLAYSGWYPFGPERGILTLAPDGRASTWSAGGCCGRSYEKGTDDVAFLDALIAQVRASGCTTDRVLATGIGNGGMMAEHWAWHSEVPSAVVSVGGGLQRAEPPPADARPIPVLRYHGTADGFIPLDGSPGRMPGGARGGGTVPTGVGHQRWAHRNGAEGPPQVIAEGDLACLERPGRATTTLCLVHRGFDTWPGARDAQVNSDLELADATRGAWEWVLHETSIDRPTRPGR